SAGALLSWLWLCYGRHDGRCALDRIHLNRVTLDQGDRGVVRELGGPGLAVRQLDLAAAGFECLDDGARGSDQALDVAACRVRAAMRQTQQRRPDEEQQKQREDRG